MTHLGLFEGIGGFSLAARWMGWDTLAWCEWNEFCQRILRYHFPESEGFGDITKTDFTKYANRIDILTGGFPCQPFSIAGEQRGSEDDRELSQEYIRAVRQIKPNWVVAENVGNILNKKFRDTLNLFCSCLENEGYQEPLVFDCTSDAVCLPTMERHIWIITQTNCKRSERSIEETFQNKRIFSRKFQRGNQGEFRRWELSKNRVSGMGKGISDRLDITTIPKSKWHGESIKSYGNAIPPQVAYEIFKVIDEINLTS